MNPVPMVEVRRTEVVRREKLPEGLDALVHRAHGLWNGRDVWRRRLWEESGAVELEAHSLRDISDHDLGVRLREARQVARRRGARAGEVAARLLPPIVEAAYRALGIRPYREQIMGALGIAQGRLVEMGTGEGKTLTIALAAVPAGWTGLPCHVVTANDYLAERDATYLNRFYRSCGLRAGFIAAPLKPEERQAAYAADIVYTTSKELVADFLRDRLQLGPLSDAGRRLVARFLRPGKTAPMLTRGLHTAIVDEADNQMIDEAVTPLIISRAQENEALVNASQEADRLADLMIGAHYELDYTFKEVRLTDAGRAWIADWCEGQEFKTFSQPAWMGMLITQALQARHFFVRDKQYVIMDGQVVIVDEYTGRLMPGRNWRLGLHQAVEAKERVPISNPAESLARLSFQRFFRLCRRLSGITGTAAEAGREFWSIYELPFVAIPPHKPCARQDWPGRVFADAETKWHAIVEQIVALHRTGQPILIGTRSVVASEHLGRLLAARSLTYHILNAVRHREEAAVVQLAGERGSITIATNMAGRGTDIRLGTGVVEVGGLHVILTERHESGRIDRQLMGRSGRQGDPGSTCIFASLEDELVERFMPRFVRRAAEAALRRGMPGGAALAAWVLNRAQRRAERFAFRQRRTVMAQDQQMADALLAGEAIDQL